MTIFQAVLVISSSSSLTRQGLHLRSFTEGVFIFSLSIYLVIFGESTKNPRPQLWSSEPSALISINQYDSNLAFQPNHDKWHQNTEMLNSNIPNFYCIRSLKLQLHHAFSLLFLKTCVAFMGHIDFGQLRTETGLFVIKGKKIFFCFFIKENSIIFWGKSSCIVLRIKVIFQW